MKDQQAHRATEALSSVVIGRAPPVGDTFDDALLRAKERARHAWGFVVLVEIGNYTTLRRHLGRRRVESVVEQVAHMLAGIDRDAAVQIASRNLIEMTCRGESRESLDVTLAGIEALFDAAIDIDGEFHAIDVVLGAGAMPAAQHDEVRLVEEAERALGEARGDRVPVARDVSLSAATVDRAALARDLHRAMERDELFLHYQPKVHIRRQEVCSVEALIRWRHPTRGLVLPNDFIPIAEESRDIVTLTLWTLRRVIADQRTLSERGHDLTIFINIAGALLANARFVRQACALVQGSGAKIGFEITETSVIRDPDSAIANLKVFAEIGIIVAIDDYGAGLSSLAYLKRLPARELKIDKLFVTQLTSSNRDPLIVRSTIDLAHALEMEVVAEGVETQAALALLAVMGCDMAQGFLISRPIGLDALIVYLDEGRGAAPQQVVPGIAGRLTSAFRRA